MGVGLISRIQQSDQIQIISTNSKIAQIIKKNPNSEKLSDLTRNVIDLNSSIGTS